MVCRAAGCRGYREPERTAPPHLTLHSDLASHEFRELFADGEPQPGAAVLSRGRVVGLAEGLEQAPLCLRGQPDAGVLDFEPHRGLGVSVVHERYRDHDFALLRKLERIRHQIEQDLAEASRITPESGRDVRMHEAGEVQPFAERARGHQL